ncbi:phosphotransferase enzyme family protein [Brachybacterium tyrofermentans]|uniref:phosphotransferase enzyme family protein n=1 Tax=Brachybacterium tyrofermentans TaxID=47848 RepID=UPI003F9034C8
MASRHELQDLLLHWTTLLGPQPSLGPELPARQLWPVTSGDGRKFVLKHVGPWRNLPLADQARILSHLSSSGVLVAPFLVTENAAVYAGDADESFVLIPWIDHDSAPSGRSSEREFLVGGALAELHVALANYPWPANSYTEGFLAALASEDLLLPPDLLADFRRRRESMLAGLTPLSLQLVHGDLTPDNIVVSDAQGRVGFLDLDHLPLAPRIWDIARYLSRSFRRTVPEQALAAVTAVVGGYHRIAPLGEQEMHALPTMIATMHLLEASWTRRIMDGDLERRLLPEQEAELGSMLDALRWQFRHPQAVEDAVRAPGR